MLHKFFIHHIASKGRIKGARNERQGVIYCATNKKTNKKYIGLTYNVYQRRKSHYKSAYNEKSKHKFHKALREYGCLSFKWEVIDREENEHNLAMTEMFYIDKYKTFSDGYNSTQGGEVGDNRKHTPQKCAECRKRRDTQIDDPKKKTIAVFNIIIFLLLWCGAVVGFTILQGLTLN